MKNDRHDMYGRIVLAGKDHLTSTGVLKLSRYTNLRIIFSGKFRKLIELHSIGCNQLFTLWTVYSGANLESLLMSTYRKSADATCIWNIRVHREPNPFHDDLDQITLWIVSWRPDSNIRHIPLCIRDGNTRTVRLRNSKCTPSDLNISELRF